MSLLGPVRALFKLALLKSHDRVRTVASLPSVTLFSLLLPLLPLIPLWPPRSLLPRHTLVEALLPTSIGATCSSLSWVPMVLDVSI